MTKYQEAVEAVARVLWIAESGGSFDWENLDKNTQFNLKSDAQAALTAALQVLREPDEAMKKAGEFTELDFSYGDEDSFEYLSKDGAAKCFVAMLDAVGEK